MFSRQTAGRFEKDRGLDEGPGPGSYDLPSTLDDRNAAIMDGPERWHECSVSTTAAGESIPMGGGPLRSDDSFSISLSVCDTPRTPSVHSARRGAAAEKENRVPPPMQRKKSLQGLRPMSPQPSVNHTSAEARKLYADMDRLDEDLKHKKRENRDLQQQLAARDRKLQELQRRMEELVKERRDTHKRSSDLECERDVKRRQLHEKEQELASAQRKLEHLKAAAEERLKRLESKEEECRTMASESSALQEKLLACERERRQERDRERQDKERAQRRTEEAEARAQEHMSVLEESLRREECRRRDAEERITQAIAKVEQTSRASDELEDERRRCSELRKRLDALEEDRRTAAATHKVWADDKHELEDELSAAKDKAAQLGESLRRAEDQKSSLERRSQQAEASADSSRRSLEEVRSRLIEFEEERSRYGESRCKELQAKADEATAGVRSLQHELRVEREQSKELESRIAQLEAACDASAERLSECEAARRALESRPDEEARSLRAQAREAEARAEAAAEELRRWREWADEQSLREITAETQRLEELKRVREDVTRQVEEARKEVVEENRILQQRINELEGGSDNPVCQKEAKLAEQATKIAEAGAKLEETEKSRNVLEKQAEQLSRHVRELQEELQSAREDLEVARQAAEEGRDLQAQLTRASAEAACVADDLADERDQRERLEAERAQLHATNTDLQARLKALQAEHDVTVESGAATQAAEREVAQQREAALLQDRSTWQSRFSACRWQLLTELAMQRNREQNLLQAVRALQRRSRQVAEAADAGHEVTGMEEELESFRGQNRELLLSLHQMEQELSSVIAEARLLKEREEAMEGDLNRVSERNAQLGGHANQKQKIQHLMAIKTENSNLRLELKKARAHGSQLERQFQSAQFFDAVVSTGTGVEPPQQSRTPGRRAAQSVAGSPAKEARLTVRQARAQQWAYDRASTDYQHLAAMVEHFLSVLGPERFPASGTLHTAVPPTTPPAAPEVVTGESCPDGSFGAAPLLQRLRELSASISSASRSRQGEAGSRGAGEHGSSGTKDP